MTRFPIFVFATWFLFSSQPLRAQYITLTTQPASRQFVEQSVDQIYNFEFGQADATLEKMQRQYPAHPVVSLLKAVSSYWQWFPARTKARLEASIRQQLAISSKASDA